MMDFIDDFIALSKTLSFSAAAGQRCLSQPAFTRRIQKLEEEVGVRLIDRGKIPVVLTPAGEIFLNYARTLRHTLFHAVEETRKADDYLSPIRIATTHSLAITLLPMFVRSRFPRSERLSILVQHREQCLQDLENDVVNFALVPAIPREAFSSSLKATVLEKDFLVLAAQKNLGENQNFLAYPETTFLGQLTKSIKKRMMTDLALTVYTESTSSEVLKAFVMAGIGISFLPKSLIQAELSAGILEKIRSPDFQIPFENILLEKI
jgi:DNA-binding transcriptional LysR family regulator